MMAKRAVAAAMALGLFCGTASAQDAPESEGAQECRRLASEILPVSVCLDPDRWALADISDEAEMAFQTLDQGLFLIVITEPDYFDVETLRKAVLTNAQLGSGLNRIQIEESGTVMLDGRQFGRIVYRANIDGVKATYDNYFTGIEGEGSVQFIMFTADRPIEPYADQIAQVTAGIVVGGEAPAGN